jgi:glutathione S-transferase
MTLTLYLHPLSSFCQKVLVAFYENGTPFEPRVVNLADETSSAALRKLWPIGKFPVLRDDANDKTIPETSIIIEYLERHYPGRTRLIPQDSDLALQARLSDRFYDLYVNEPMGKIVTDRLRPAGQNDIYGVEHARARLRTAYGILDRELATRRWAAGDAFTMADCAAAPSLFFANMVAPFTGAHGNIAAYFDRLTQRPSVARVAREAEPYLAMVPK